MMSNPKINLPPEERAQRLLDGREGWRAYVCGTGGGTAVCVVEREPEVPGASYARVTGSEGPAEPYLVGIYLPSQRQEPAASKQISEADLESYVFAALTGGVHAAAEEPMPLSITVVDIAGRTDPIYVFAHHDDGERFAAAINEGDELDNPAYVCEVPVNTGDEAEMRIASERADVLEDHGLEDHAERLRTDPALLGEIAMELSHLRGSAQEEIVVTAERWLAEDADPGGAEN